MTKPLRSIFLSFLLLVSGILSACRSALEVGDGGFLSEVPCGPPCFWGITPDITTEEDAIKTFQKHFDISNCDEWPELGSHKEIACDPVIIEFSTFGKVNHISYSSSQQITIGDAIAKYGQPNAVKVLGWSEDNGGLTTSVTMLLYFDNIHTIIGLPQQEGTNYDVAPGTVVGGINYPGSDSWEGTRYDAQSWHGYDKYEGPTWGGP